jgi:Flp pilus assembly protein CpaB
LGLVLALISGLGVFYVLLTAQPTQEPIRTTKVVVALQQIPGRTEISADRVGQLDWPAAVPTPLGAFENPAEVVGTLSSGPIYPQQPIIKQMVISKSDAEARHSNAALILEKGQVGIALGVTLNSSVAEAVQAGDRVDLIVTYSIQLLNPPAGQNPQYIVTQKTLENLLILQVGPWPQGGDQAAQNNTGGNVSILTIQVPEQDALALKHLENTATSYALVLRAANDDQIFTTEPVTIEYLNKRFKFNIPGSGQ